MYACARMRTGVHAHVCIFMCACVHETAISTVAIRYWISCLQRYLLICALDISRDSVNISMLGSLHHMHLNFTWTKIRRLRTAKLKQKQSTPVSSSTVDSPITFVPLKSLLLFDVLFFSMRNGNSSGHPCNITSHLDIKLNWIRNQSLVSDSQSW